MQKSVIDTYNQAVRLHRLKKYRDAKPLYSEVIRKCDDFMPAFVNLASILLNEGKPREARKLLEVAAANNYQTLSYFYNLGKLYDAEANWFEAENAFKQAAALDTDSNIANARLSDILLARERYTECIRLCKSVLQKENNVKCFFNLGESYRKTQQYKKSILKYKAFLIHTNLYPEAAFRNIGICYMLLFIESGNKRMIQASNIYYLRSIRYSFYNYKGYLALLSNLYIRINRKSLSAQKP